MDVKKLLGLRPKAQDAASLREAIAAAEAAQVAARTRAAELEAARSATLLDGTAADVESAERDLATARGDAERAAVMADGLRARLAEAETREAVEAARAAVREAEDLAAAFLTFARGEYPALAARIAAGLRHETRAQEAMERASRLMSGLPPDGQAALAAEGVRVPESPAAQLHESFSRPGGFGGFVVLPAISGAPFPLTNERAYW